MFKFINYNGIRKKTIASDITASLTSFFFFSFEKFSASLSTPKMENSESHSFRMHLAIFSFSYVREN